MSAPHWHILGAGAIGCLCAHALKEAGADVTLILREGRDVSGSGSMAVTLERDGATVEREFAVTSAAQSPSVSHLLVTTKAYDVNTAIEAFGHALRPHCIAVLLVNGMGLVEALRSRYHHVQFFCGTTTEGAYRSAATTVCHAGRGETRVGGENLHTAPYWFDLWSRGLHPCHWEVDIDVALWAKLAVNCVVNPLTALHQVRNGALASEPELAQAVDALCKEVAQVSYAAGFTHTAQNIHTLVKEVIAGTADNRSSMMQDVAKGKPTEIDYINGYLLRVANDHGIPAPLNHALVEAIHACAN